LDTKIVDPKRSYEGISGLLEIMSVLRGENGCLWDKEQTHESIRQCFIEEVYEAAEAIDTGDKALLLEELGDVLLQVVFHCQIETEIDGFTFDDVCNEICKKLVVRHPHVFGEVYVNDSEEVLKNWDRIKMATKGQMFYTDTLNNVAKSLPALMRAQKINKRAARAGLDCSDVNAVWLNFTDALQSESKEKIADDLGDLLFACTNVARKFNLDAEELLSKSTEKFIKNFEKTENLVFQKTQKDMKDINPDEINGYWERSKLQ